MTELENALKTTLSVAAGGAPAPPPELTGQVQRRYRRRRAGRAGLAAVMAIVLAGAGTLTADHLYFQGPSTSGVASGGGLPTPPVPDPVPVADLWPQAVRTVSDALPGNGRAYEPVTLVDDHRLLVTTMSGFEKADALWLYDLDREHAERIATIPVRTDAASFAAGFTVGAGEIVWWDSVKSQGGELGEIWTVPLTGGTPRLITTTRLEESDFALEHLTVAVGDGDDDKVVWSTPAGVYEAPFAGGRARQTSGTRGNKILDWPWIGTGDNPGRTPVMYERIRNLRTGEQRTAKVTRQKSGPRSGRSARNAGGDVWVCGLTWCVGDSPGGTTFAEGRDGGNGRTLFRGARSMSSDTPPALDRFVLQVIGRSMGGEPQRYPQGTYLYDLETGKVADLGIEPTTSHPTLDDARERLYAVEGPGTYTLIDLKKIK